MPVIRAVSLDLDGTLVVGTTSGQFLAERLGHGAQMAELERAYTRGEMTNRTVADLDGAHYAGRRKSELHPWLRDAPLISGLRPTIDAIKQAGMVVLLGTVTWRFIAEYYMGEFGFDAASGVEMEEDASGRLTGRVSRYFDEYDKVSFVESCCSSRGISMAETAAVGDSRSDIPLFGKVGLSIAFNATLAARSAAIVQLAGPDLTAILPLIFR